MMLRRFAVCLFIFSISGFSVLLANSDVRIFHSIEDMKAARSLKDGAYVKVLGYYEPGDGGTAEYIIRRSDKGDSSEFNVTLNNGFFAVLLTPQFVNYKMFGAKGDGENNDAIQIAQAHAYANKKNIPVWNSSGEFWLKSVKKIVIKTNTRWDKTVFHIDESFNNTNPRFEIASDHRPDTIKLSPSEKATLLASVKPGVNLIPLLAKYKNCLVFIADAKDRIGYRSGESYKGQSWAREEFFYVEEHGRIVGDIAWQFKDYTKLVAFPIDKSYLRIEGGTFYLSGDNPTTKGGNYLNNGIAIRRSRTIISGQWIGLEPGAADTSTLNPRTGFYSFSGVFDVRLEDVRLIPYEQNRGVATKNVTAGTYGISMGRVMNCTFKNVTAEGSHSHWGVFGSNLVKNFNIEDCRLNRVDVHFHCWNLKISNSEIGFRGITVTGGGSLKIENSSCAGRNFISFRSDFGSKWDGDIRIINSTFKVSYEDKAVAVLGFAPRDFGYKYPVGFGRSVVFENFNIDFSGVKNKTATCWMMRLPSFSKMKSGERLFFPEFVRFENVAVTGREKGVRLFEINDAGSYQIRKPGGDITGHALKNADFYFENVQLEDLKNEGSAASHFSLNVADGYTDAFSLYPKVKFSNCKNIIVQNDAAADYTFEECGITGFKVAKEGRHPGKLAFEQCDFYPVLKDSARNAYNFNSGSRVSFSDCVIYAPVYKNKVRPDLFDKNGIVEINNKVRFNHSNTLLGQEIIDYYGNRKISISPRFISMLKSHHEMEVESLK